MARDIRIPSMINPNGEEFKPEDPLAETEFGAAHLAKEESRMQQAGQRLAGVASETWDQTKEKAAIARERTEFFLRENPVPTIVGALVVGVAIGLAIRYASSSAEKETEVKSPLGDLNLGALSLPFLWPFFKTVKRRYEDSAEAVKGGLDRVKDIDVDKYVKPLRKRWSAWTD
jgi:ElaB/YqjD/DUF883 family membrane-anchored ribosome-binding protein